MAREVWVDEADPGQWYPVDYDEDRDLKVSMRIRPLDEETRSAALRKFGKVFRNRRTRTKQRRIPDSRADESSYFYASRMWTDTKNFWVKLRNQKAVDLFAKEIQDTPDLTLNGEICLDGKWTETLRMLFLRKDVRYLNVITENGLLMDEEAAAEEEEELQEN